MAESARFEIYPTTVGTYRWRFREDGEVTAAGMQTHSDREGANVAIHKFMRAIDGAECGIHPDIIDLDTTTNGASEELASGWECPVCHRPLMGPDEACNGSFTESDHPPGVKAQPVPGTEEEGA